MAGNKLERLLKLMAVLLDTTRPLSAEQIRSSVEGYPSADASFRRAFERDKDELREMGVPLSVERVPATDPPIDGYRIHGKDYYLADPGLDPEELAALHLATMAVRVEGGAETDADREALWKLGGQDDAALGAGANWIASVPLEPSLTVVFAAITERAPIEFSYRGELREVEPARLDFQRGRWYLTGYDRLRQGERNFRLDRIEGKVTISGTAGEVDRAVLSPGQRLNSWEMGDSDPVMVSLAIDASHVAWAKRQLLGSSDSSTPSSANTPSLSSTVIADQADGSMVATVAVRNEEAFRSFVLDFLEFGEVLSPPDVRDRMVSWLRAAAP